jgi:Immunity protein 35
MTFDYNAAETAVLEVLAKAQVELDLELLVADVVEHDFGWVFFFSTKEFMETCDSSSRLAGNSPLIFDKADGAVYMTSTADTLENALENYRRGIKIRT